MITSEKIQLKISEAIELSGLTQTEIARRIGVRPTQVSCYLHRKKMPAIDTLAKLIAVLDLDPEDILCIKEHEEPATKT